MGDLINKYHVTHACHTFTTFCLTWLGTDIFVLSTNNVIHRLEQHISLKAAFGIVLLAEYETASLA